MRSHQDNFFSPKIVFKIYIYISLNTFTLSILKIKRRLLLEADVYFIVLYPIQASPPYSSYSSPSSNLSMPGKWLPQLPLYCTTAHMQLKQSQMPNQPTTYLSHVFYTDPLWPFPVLGLLLSLGIFLFRIQSYDTPVHIQAGFAYLPERKCPQMYPAGSERCLCQEEDQQLRLPWMDGPG